MTEELYDGKIVRYKPLVLRSQETLPSNWKRRIEYAVYITGGCCSKPTAVLEDCLNTVPSLRNDCSWSEAWIVKFNVDGTYEVVYRWNHVNGEWNIYLIGK